MNQYYLIAQLPSLDCVNETTPLPITEDRFYELCSRYLGKKAFAALAKLTLVPARQGRATGYRLVDAWYEKDRQLRLALACVRAEKMKKAFDASPGDFSEELFQTAQKAVEIEDPMEAEKFLNRFRLDMLETLRPADAFSENMLFYYGLKLKLILRIRQFDENAGRDAYRNIYDSILRGDGQEAEQ